MNGCGFVRRQRRVTASRNLPISQRQCFGWSGLIDFPCELLTPKQGFTFTFRYLFLHQGKGNMNWDCHSLHLFSGMAKLIISQCSLTKGSPTSVSCRKRRLLLLFTCYVVSDVFTAPSKGKKISNMTQEIICTGTHLLHCSWPAGCLVTSSRHYCGGHKRPLGKAGTKFFPGRVIGWMKKIGGFLEHCHFPIFLLLLLLNFAGLALDVWEHFFPPKMKLIHLSCRHCSHSSIHVHGWRKEGQRQVIASIWHTWAFSRPIFFSLLFSLCPVKNKAVLFTQHSLDFMIVKTAAGRRFPRRAQSHACLSHTWDNL